MEPLPKNSFFETPYYRGIATMPTDDENCQELPEANNNPYFMHCLITKVRSILPPEVYLMYQSRYNENRMQYVLLLTDATDPISLSDEVYTKYLNSYNTILETNASECLIYESNDSLFGIPVWYQDWIIKGIDVPTKYKLRFNVNPVTNKIGVYGDFRSPDGEDFFYDYETPFMNCVTLIQTQLKTMFSRGYVKCSREAAERLQLDQVKLLEDGMYLCAPDWDIVSVVPRDQHVVIFLMEHIADPKSDVFK